MPLSGPTSAAATQAQRTAHSAASRTAAHSRADAGGRLEPGPRRDAIDFYRFAASLPPMKPNSAMPIAPPTIAASARLKAGQ